MNDSEFIPLDEESTAEKAFDALRQLGLPHMPDCGVGEYPDSLSMKTVRRCGYGCGVGWEERTDVTAYRISWRRHSFYRGCDVEKGYTIVDLNRGGLGCDGYACVKRYATQLMDRDEQLDAFILLAKRGLFPLVTAFCEF